MRSRKPIRRRAALLLLVPLLLGSAATSPPSRQGLTSPLPGHSDRASLAYAEAAAAVRRKDCAGAYKALAPILTGTGQEASFAKVLLGLYAHSCEQVAYAEDRLFASANPDGPLEDWRLYILSDSAAANGHVLLAQNSLARLLGDYPGSVLRPRALLKAATIAWSRGDARRALELVEAGRSEELRGDEAAQLEALAWEIGDRLGDPETRAEAARRLLVNFPTKASELKVVEIFRDASGIVNWQGTLTGDQLKRRAKALLDLKLDANALATLDSVGLPGRDLEWYLLEAQALTRVHRGGDALDLLAGKEAPDPRQSAALAWARAMAADDAATAQRGRANLGSAERRQLRLLSQQYLENVAQQAGADSELAAKALKSLYADYREDDLFDRAMDALRRLRRIDPKDTTGASNLWQVGWQEYGRRNFSGAIGYWTELFSLYPEDSNARRGRYWTARAFDALGENERAQQIYNEITQADTSDFYRRNALNRLKGKPAALAAAADAREPWPIDPALDRARLLTDLGLDDLALSEAELVREKVQPRSLRALEAVVLARRGDRRKSVLVIRDAFPALGGPFQATVPDEARKLYYPLDYQEPIRTWATMNRLPPYLVFGIIRQESAFDTNAQSWAGARGLMQLMPATARELAVKNGLDYSHERLSDPAFNVRLGTTYFRQVFSMFDENLELSLAGYNGGPYRIKRLWNESGGTEIDRFLEGLGLEESKTYVKRILVLSDSYRQLYPQAG
ncbi:MAG TPA: lytic transglycosylase domain-containing protein [Thermoanaerobaculia bacterium]|nr:lytic transglycosylase domain-containing protein [Thermoanaerobaculia bacterium]